MKGNTKMKKNKEKKIGMGQYLAKYKLAIIAYIIIYIIAGACGLVDTLLFASAIEQVTTATTTGASALYMEAIKTFLIIVGLTVFRRLCWYVSGFIYNKYSVRIMAELNLDLAKQAFKLNSKTFNDFETGTFVQRIVSDPQRIVEKLSFIVDIIIDIVTSLVMLVYITTLNFYVTIILIIVIAIGLTIESIRVKKRRLNKIVVRKNHDKINTLTTEIVRSEKDIKSLGLEEKLTEVSKEHYNTYRKSQLKMDNVDMNFWSLRNLIIDVSSILLLIFSIYLMDKGLLVLASFIIIYSNNSSLYSLIRGIGEISNSFVDIKVSSERMFALFNETDFVTEKFGNVELDKIVGEIEFKDVCYTFKEYEYDEPSRANVKAFKKRKPAEKKLISENKVFERLSFKISPNSTVAFVGKSGSGKSTILNLMSKMYEVDNGEVLIDGVNINDLSKNTLRSSISLVNQFPYIFDMTIKENLLLAKGDATDEEVIDSLKKASLMEFIDTLPKGIETKVGESGIKLSGGQKQRLAIARALIRKSSIIFFDESTSSLDNFAQEEVKRSIDGLKGQSTIVIVAHRLSTIKNVDKIFFLDKGEIVDSGTFEELYARNDKFKTMFLAENI